MRETDAANISDRSSSSPTAAGLTFAFVVPCYNEAQNLPNLLPVLDQTSFDGRRPIRTVVVSDASQDGTDEFVGGFAQTSLNPVRLIRNPVRRGKSSAINQALEAVRDIDVIFMISGDVLPDTDCVRILVEAFDDPAVGVAGGRQIPIGPRGNVASDITRFMWALHHSIATRHPKTTEVTVFRNVIQEIDWRSLVDEAAIELAVRRKGYAIRYLPAARILSPAPLRLRDYLKQRTSVTLGYLRLNRDEGHVMETQKLSERLRALRETWMSREFLLRTIASAIAAEIVVRVRAWVSFIMGAMSDGIWGRSQSTKRDIAVAMKLEHPGTEGDAVQERVSAY